MYELAEDILGFSPFLSKLSESRDVFPRSRGSLNCKIWKGSLGCASATVQSTGISHSLADMAWEIIGLHVCWGCPLQFIMSLKLLIDTASKANASSLVND